MYSFGVYIGLITIFRLVEAQHSLVTSEPFATRDKEFMLTCDIGSTATATFLIWSRNDVSVANIRISDCYEVDAGQGLYNFYRYNCTTSNRRYNLIIPTPRINSEADSQWTCGPSDGSTESNTYTLQFYTPPTGDPVITGYDGTPRFLDNNVVLTCNVNGGIPLATITWTCKNASIPGTSNGTSRYTVTIDTSYNGRRCYCTSAHPTWSRDKVVGSQVFVVHYPPTTNPVIRGHDGSFRYEGDKVTLTCTVSGGSPPANLSWICNGQIQTFAKQTTTGTTVTSDITVTMTKELYGMTCLCRGRHCDTRYTPNITSNQFRVYFPPTIQAIIDKTSITEGQAVSMYCLARGVPDRYTYGGWVQMYRSTVIRSGNDFILSHDKRNLTLSSVTHQDIGTYSCQAHNTIKDQSGILYQHGSSDLNIKFSAIFNSSRKFYAELNKTAGIKIPFFVNPVVQDLNNVTLTKQNMNMKQRSDIQIKTTNLTIAFHGKTINVKGQEIIIRMFQFNSELQGNYTVGVKNYLEGSVSSFVFEVNPFGPPENPKKFHILKSTADSVTWLAGNNGGHEQSFVISYQQTGKIGTLKTQIITETDITEKKQNYTHTISNLYPDTEYSFWIYAYNVKGSTKRNTGSMEHYMIRTQKSVSNDNNTDGIVIGIVVALSVVLVVVGIIGFVLIRRRESSQGTKKKDGTLVNVHSNASRNNDNDEKEDEIPINILYKSAGPNYKKPGGVANAEVDKKKENKSGVDNLAAFCSHVEKKKPAVDPSTVYAEVNKSNKIKNGMAHENVGNIKREKSDNAYMYESADEMPGFSTGAIPQKMQSKPQKSERKNKGDLTYIDLDLGVSAQNINKKATIHGVENTTDYAEVDFSRRAVPLQQEQH